MPTLHVTLPSVPPSPLASRSSALSAHSRLSSLSPSALCHPQHRPGRGTWPVVTGGHAASTPPHWLEVQHWLRCQRTHHQPYHSAARHRQHQLAPRRCTAKFILIYVLHCASKN